MTGAITVRPTDRRVIWVFDIDLGPQELEAFNHRNGVWPLQQALGAATLDADHVDLIRVEDLGELGLPGYLEQGMGVTANDLAPHLGALQALKGAVLVLSARAFGAERTQFTPAAPLHLVATLREDPPDMHTTPLSSNAEKGAATGPRKSPSDAAMSGRVASLALLVIFALTGLVIWLAA